MKKHFFLGFASILLCACAINIGNTSSTPEVHPAYASTGGVLHIPPLKLSISHPIPLSTTPSYGDTFDISGTGAQTFFAFRVENGHQSQGLTDWMIPTDIAKKLNADDACAVLGQAGTGVYLPVKTDRLMQCAVFINPDGDRIIAAAGFSDTFESPDHPGSMLLIPRKKDVVVFSNVIAFPTFNAWLRQKSDAFYGQHSEDNLWPPTTPAAEAYYTDATDYVGQMIAEPSKEVADGMNELEQWTNRITLD